MKKLLSDWRSELMDKTINETKNQDVKKILQIIFKVTKVPASENDLCPECKTRLNEVQITLLTLPLFECPKCGYSEGFNQHIGNKLFSVEKLPQGAYARYQKSQIKKQYKKTGKKK